MANWSYTQLALYKRCPLQFFWARVEPQPGLPRDPRRAFIGHLLGDLISRFYLEQWWRRGAEAQALMVAHVYPLADAIDQREQIVWRPGERDPWIALAIETIPKILAVIIEHRLIGPFVAVEYGITVPLGGPERDQLHGRSDLVVGRTDGTLVLADLKGGGSIGKFVSPDQLRVYALGALCDPRLGRLPDRVGFWWLRHSKIVWRTFTRENLLTFVEGVQNTIARVRAKYFGPEPGSHCAYCDFRNECAAGKEYLWNEKYSTKLASDENAGTVDLNSL